MKCDKPHHPPHDVLLMKCCTCPYEWPDCPGAWGRRLGDPDPVKHCCEACGSIYWKAEPLNDAP